MRKKIKLFYLAVAAFVIIAGGLITLHRLNADFRKAEPRCPRALVLVTTRELALQAQKS